MGANRRPDPVLVGLAAAAPCALSQVNILSKSLLEAMSSRRKLWLKKIRASLFLHRIGLRDARHWRSWRK